MCYKIPPCTTRPNQVTSYTLHLYKCLFKNVLQNTSVYDMPQPSHIVHARGHNSILFTRFAT